MPTAPANAAIYYAPEAFTTSGPKLMGRNAAGESFLKGFARHARVTNFHCMVDDSRHIPGFTREIAAQGRREPVSGLSRQQTPELAGIGALHYPAPGLADLAWRRTLFADNAWSLTGITHTTASAGAMDGLTAMLTAPVQPWDAVICTSTAVHDNVRILLDAERERLAARFGATRFVEPRLPVIPLGINTDEFAFSDRDRRQARAAIGADADTRVVLFTGRLSFHAKAHPLAMYQALEGAARELPTGQKVMLVECGWHANDHIAKAFAAAAALACPSVIVRNIDGRVAADRRTAWAAADVFCSLSDNIQETFGLVPVEAMAAGLPCVVSDWNGYKDTVRDGVDGFRIPTMAPLPGAGADMALAHALGTETYDMYCGQTCMIVTVDISAATAAFRRLFTEPDLRAAMAASGRKRAREAFDWSAIVPRYQSLWAELAEIRSAATSPVVSSWPARMEPFTAFAGYPTSHLTPTTPLRLAAPDAETAAARLVELERLDMVFFANRSRLTAAEVTAILTTAARGPVPAMSLVADIPEPRRAIAFRGLGRLTKLGILVR